MEQDAILDEFEKDVASQGEHFEGIFLDGYEQVAEDDWAGGSKYQHASEVFKHVASGRYFRVNKTRSGSYYSDFHYMDPTVQEVWPVEVVSVSYTNKKPD